VKAPCLEYALAYRVDDGVWGGTSERQRKRILRRQRATTTSPGGAPDSGNFTATATATATAAAAAMSSLEPAGRP
jgi:hypothetical protein